MGLIEKVVKKKRLQRMSGSLAMIIPGLWIRSMNWTQQTEFMMEFRPGTKQIIITEDKKVGFKESMTRKSPGGKDGECNRCGGEGCNVCSAQHLEDGEKTGEPVVIAD